MIERRRNGAMKLLWLCCGLAAFSAPAMGQTVTPESLNGSTVKASVTYALHTRRDGREFRTTATIDYRLTFGPGGTVTGTVTRNANLPRGPATRTLPVQTTLGRPREIKGSGHVVMVLDGNALTILRTFEVGGNKTTIAFADGGRACSIRGTMAKEVGAGTSRRDHIKGGTVEIISGQQVAATCQVSR
jgi:hypothetical protein